MARVIFADDSEGLVDEIKTYIRDNKIKDVVCVTTVEEAEKVIKDEEDIACFIADLVFAGSRSDGIDLLEMVRGRYAKTECILLTGYKLDDVQLARLRKIRGKLVHKIHLTKEVLGELLTCKYILEDQRLASAPKLDVGEVMLRIDRMQDASLKSSYRSRTEKADERKPTLPTDKTDSAKKVEDEARRIRQSLQASFATIDESLQLDRGNLKKMSSMAMISISSSLLFLLICVILILMDVTDIAKVFAVFSLVANVMSALLFRREDKLRKSTITQMDKFSPLYSLSMLFTFCQGIEDKRERDKYIGKLVDNFRPIFKQK